MAQLAGDMLDAFNVIEPFIGKQRKDYLQLNGNWEEIKKICDCNEHIMKETGVSWAKRIALRGATVQTDVSVKTNENGHPEFKLKSWYPLGITKESSFVANGEEFDVDDRVDTCMWTTRAICHEGVLIQVRKGDKGLMYDVRAILDEHPNNKSEESPIMLFMWVLINPQGKKLVAEHWMRKKN